MLKSHYPLFLLAMLKYLIMTEEELEVLIVLFLL